MNARRVGLVARFLALFFITALADVPVLCADEWGGAAAGPVENEPTEISVALSDAQPVQGLGTTSTDSDCGCPCHRTFGSQPALALSPLIRLPEIPDETAPPGISPPVRSPEHPPQNLI